MATVTIIAASSTSCHSGFLPTDLDNISTRLETPLPLSISLHTTKCTAVRGGFHNHPNIDPISERGWTYQEEQLSARFLKFTRADIQWKCKAGTACLCGEKPDLHYVTEWGRSPRLSNERRIAALVKQWAAMAENLSRRKFTNEMDKLAAISGLALRQDTALRYAGLRQTYIAGCWSYGPLDLCGVD